MILMRTPVKTDTVSASHHLKPDKPSSVRTRLYLVAGIFKVLSD